MSRLAVLALSLIVAQLSVHCQAAANGLQPSLASQNPNALQIVLSMDRTTYRLGDDPRVSIVLRNVSANPVRIPNKGAVVDVWLTILDPSGHELAEDPNTPLHWLGYSGGLGIVIQPGATFVETAEKGTGPLFPLSYWSYRITVPGTYRITAKYLVSGTRSNTISIVVGS